MPDPSHPAASGPAIDPDWEVSPRDVAAIREAGEDLVLLDCRTPEEYAIARIDGAQLVPLGELGSRLAELDALADRRVVVHCHHGARSLQMAAILRQQGFEDVRSMAGGIDGWSQTVDPAVPRY